MEYKDIMSEIDTLKGYLNYHKSKAEVLKAEIATMEIDLRRQSSKDAAKDMTTREILGEGEFVSSLSLFDVDDEAGIVYGGALFIMIYEDEYSLLLGSEEITSQCLKELEAILAEYAIEEEIEMDFMHKY